MTANIAWDYGTRAWQQRLVLDGPQWRLMRRTKESSPEDTARREVALASLDEIELAPGTRLVRPKYTSDGAVYELDVCEVLMSQLWPQLRLVGLGLEATMTALGKALASIHSLTPPEAGTGGAVSPHLLRLRAHLDADPTSWAGQVVAQLKPTVLASLRRWLDEVSTGTVLCHGGFSLGSAFGDGVGKRLDLVTGDEFMLSRPELDLGWMLGELTEIEYLAGMRGGNGMAYAGAGEWLLEGWTGATGQVPDRVMLDKVIALRNFLQACDVAETTRSIDAAERNSLFLSYLVERVTLLDHVPAQRRHAAA